MRNAAALFLAFSTLVPPALAHEARPGYLEIRETAEHRYSVLWRKPARGAMLLRLDPVLPPECTFEEGKEELTGSALLVRASLRCEGGIAGKSVGIAGPDALLTDVLVRVHHENGVSETHLLRPGSPSVTLGGGGARGARALAFLRLGIEHILLGVDHLLFVLGLLLIVKSRMMLVKTITSFTVAHSVTLALATLGYASLPVGPLNAAIALSILFLGPEIVRSWRGETSLTLRHPWVVAFAFGFLHGFGFASGLSAMGLPRAEIPLALFVFNVGVELGQLVFVFLIVLLERSFHALEIHWPRVVEVLPGYAVGTLGAFWTIQRTAMLLGWRPF